MITSTPPAETLPNSATELLLSLDHLPREEELVRAKGLKHTVLHSYGSIKVMPKEWLPHPTGWNKSRQGD